MVFDEVFSEAIRRGMHTVREDGLTAAQYGAKNAFDTHVRTGRFVDPANRTEWQNYKTLVWKLTRRQPLHLLENIEKRGPVAAGGWHLDHVVSVLRGFKEKIPAEEIANIKNLRMIPALENIRKGSK